MVSGGKSLEVGCTRRPTALATHLSVAVRPNPLPRVRRQTTTPRRTQLNIYAQYDLVTTRGTRDSWWSYANTYTFNRNVDNVRPGQRCSLVTRVVRNVYGVRYWTCGVVCWEVQSETKGVVLPKCRGCDHLTVYENVENLTRVVPYGRSCECY